MVDYSKALSLIQHEQTHRQEYHRRNKHLNFIRYIYPMDFFSIPSLSTSSNAFLQHLLTLLSSINFQQNFHHQFPALLSSKTFTIIFQHYFPGSISSIIFQHYFPATISSITFSCQFSLPGTPPALPCEYHQTYGAGRSLPVS